MPVHAEKVRLVNPHPKKRRASSGARRKKSRNRNPNALMALGLVNPHKEKRSKMRRKAKRSGASKSSHRKAPRRRNPFGLGRKRHTRRRRNPSALSMAGNTGSILKGGFFALVGLVLARQLPQMFLGARNTGIIGYVSNIAATLVAAMVGGKFLGPEAGKFMAVGGGVYVVNRALTDNLSPVGKVLSLSGIGDHNALGDIQSGYFPLPVPTNASGQPIIPVELRSAPMTAAAAASKGVGSVASSSRFNSRF